MAFYLHNTKKVVVLFVTFVMIISCKNTHAVMLSEPRVDKMVFKVTPLHDTLMIGDTIVLFLSVQNVSHDTLFFPPYSNLMIMDGANDFMAFDNIPQSLFVGDLLKKKEEVLLLPGMYYQDTLYCSTLKEVWKGLLYFHVGENVFSLRYSFPHDKKDKSKNIKWRLVSNSVTLYLKEHYNAVLVCE